VVADTKYTTTQNPIVDQCCNPGLNSCAEERSWTTNQPQRPPMLNSDPVWWSRESIGGSELEFVSRMASHW
jgi:hypothetical protein